MSDLSLISQISFFYIFSDSCEAIAELAINTLNVVSLLHTEINKGAEKGVGLTQNI